MIIISGLRLITSGGDEEKVGEERKRIMYGVAGLLMIYLGDIGLEKVFYKVNKEVYSGVTGVTPGVDAAEGVNQIVGITNLIVSFVGPVAVLMLIVGAIMYATAGGNDDNMEKAKRVVMVAIVGIVIIFGAFALVSTVVAGRLSDAGALLN
jgi:type IV secretory pathway VirB2 component (pilin)